MHPLIPGYRLTEELHQSTRTQVFRGFREADQHAVILKTLNPAHPDMRGLVRLRREHRILSALQIPGVAWVHGHEPRRNQVALVFDDCGAEPLSEL